MVVWDPAPITRTKAADIEVVTELLDLAGLPVGQLRSLPDEVLAPGLDRVLGRVDGPRANIGETGPPGRVD